VVGGILPEEDQPKLREAGVAAIYTPKDYALVQIVDDMAGLVEAHRKALSASAPGPRQ
jgi:(2R)-ethylmalonyl-CoA mutase